MNGDETVSLNATNVFTKENMIPELSTSLNESNWVSFTNATAYVPVTIANFGLPSSVTISNVPFSGI